MVGGAAAALGAAAVGRARSAGKVTDDQARLIDKITAASATGAASLSDVKHIVILMQENRSFDHYFGTLSGVRASPTRTRSRRLRPVRLPARRRGHAAGYTQPFNLQNNPPTENGYDTNDIDHSWGPQHNSWNDGAMNQFIVSHLATDGDNNGPVTMGYFTRAELPFYHALADAFTICDGYHCSVLGPTDPNRLMAFSAWIDPAGAAGGPVITTASDRLAMTGKLNWETMPEALQKAGVSWKVYGDPTGRLGLDVLPYFHNFSDPFSLTNLELIAKGITPTFPGTFQSDVKSGGLPSVSWILAAAGRVRAPGRAAGVGRVPGPADPEHPRLQPRGVGPDRVHRRLRRERRLLRPRRAARPGGRHRRGVPDRHAAERGRRHRRPDRPRLPDPGPGHLPVQRGRLQVLGHPRPHVSVLRLIETRFGVTVPNLTAWRRSVTGDFTGALNLTTAPVTAVPALPATSLVGNATVIEEAVLNALTGTLDVGIDYPIPASNVMPAQETTPARPTSPDNGEKKS